MPHHRLFVLFALLSTATHAQWLNYPTPGAPRTPDGKLNLGAPVPRAANGKPDLSGVWYIQPTSLAEMKRLYGDLADAANKVTVPGMELDTISKYAINILVDFKPEDSPMRPEAAEIFRHRVATDYPNTYCLPLGIPLAGLVSEPDKMVQSPRADRHPVRIRRHASPNLHRRPPPSEGNCSTFLAGLLGRQMGARHAGGGNCRLQRQKLARHERPPT
jgi:hypothetical protein